MKQLGMIGGLGPESTVDYYKRIIEACRTKGSLSTPEMVIYSVDLEEVLDLVGKQQWEQLIYLLVAKLKALHRAGADFAVITANTPHIVFDEVQARSPLPMLSIVTATLEKARELNLGKVALLGTRFTMEHNFFAQPFSEQGIAVVVPAPADREYIHQKLVDEIELGIFTAETSKGLFAIVERMRAADRVDCVILGCTELPLIMEQREGDVPFLNTTAIHVQKIVEYMKS